MKSQCCFDLQISNGLRLPIADLCSEKNFWVPFHLAVASWRLIIRGSSASATCAAEATQETHNSDSWPRGSVPGWDCVQMCAQAQDSDFPQGVDSQEAINEFNKSSACFINEGRKSLMQCFLPRLKKKLKVFVGSGILRNVMKHWRILCWRPDLK